MPTINEIDIDIQYIQYTLALREGEKSGKMRKIWWKFKIARHVNHLESDVYGMDVVDRMFLLVSDRHFWTSSL